MSVRSAVGRRLDRHVRMPSLEWLGSEYGGYVAPSEILGARSVCYSAGVGEDATFDLALIERFGCDVWALDPTPRAIEFAEPIARAEPRFHFLPVGVWSEPAELRLYAPRDPAHVSHSAVNLQDTDSFFVARCESVATLVQRLGHDHVDLLKLNIEGAEVPALTAMLAAGLRPSIVCVSFEHPSKARLALTKLRLRAAGYGLVARAGAKHTYVRAGATR